MNGTSHTVLITPLAVLLVFVVLVLCVRQMWRLWKEVGQRPPESAYPAAWSSHEAGCLGLWALFLYGQMAFAGLLLRRFGLLNNDVQLAAYLLAGQASLYVLFLGLVAWMLRHKRASARTLFGLNRGTGWLVAGTALGGLVIVIVPMGIVSGSTQWVLKLLGWPLEPQTILRLIARLHHGGLMAGLVAVAVVGAPVFEETLFRGIFYPFLRQRLGLGPAVWINSTVFAAFHCHLPSFPALVVLAVMFTLLYEWRGNLLAPIFCHAAFNALSLALVLAFPPSISLLH